MHQNNLILSSLFHYSICNTPHITAAPVQRIYRPQYRDHIQLLLKALVPAPVRRTYILHLHPGDLLKHLVCPDQFFLELLPIFFRQLHMTVCMIPNQMPFCLHPLDHIRMQAGMLPCHKKRCHHASLLQPVQQLLRVIRVRPVIC